MIPHISDKGRRTLRTFLQVLAAFVSFAAIYPTLVHALGLPTGSRVEVWLATAGAWITGAAVIVTRLMAVPAVDQVLTLLGVGSIPRSSVQVSLKELEAVTADAGSFLEQEVPETAPAIERLEDIEAALAADPEAAPVVVPAAAAIAPAVAAPTVAPAAVPAPSPYVA